MHGSAVWRGRVAWALPDLLAAAVAGFSVGPMLLLVTGHFGAALAVPLGLVGAGVACWLAGLPDRDELRGGPLWTWAALLVALVWLAYNIRFNAQDVYQTRDPATYTITGQWLVHHNSLQIHTLPQLFGNPPNAIAASGSYAQVGTGLLNAQGDHLLPVFLGITGSLFGTTALLKTGVVLGALSLVVFFGLARRVVGPFLGLLAMLALALSTPMIFVGRDSYTEPLTLLFLTGALLFAHRGWTSGRARDWALAGLLGGAATCVRVDSYGALAGIVAAVALYVAVAGADERRKRARDAGAFMLGGAAPVTLGWIDLTHASRQYYESQHSNITHIAALLVAVTLLSPVAIWLLWRTRLRAWLASKSVAHRLPQVAAAVLGAVFVALVTRPAWQTTHGAFNQDLVNMQLRWDAPVDGTRTYNEHTLYWQAYYFGWPTIVLGFAGYGVLITRFVRERRYELSAVLMTGLSMSALYLYTSQVAPDQPWAMRRYVPVIVPLMLIAATVALRELWQRRAPVAVVLRPVVVAATAYVVLFPLAVAWPMRMVREENGQLTQLQQICTAVGKKGAVIVADPATIFGYQQTIRAFCGVPAIGLVDAGPALLSQVGAAVRAHGLVPYVLGQSPSVTGGQPGHAFSNVRVQRWPTQIEKAPDQPDYQQYAVWLSEIDADGRLRPVPPLRSGS